MGYRKIHKYKLEKQAEAIRIPHGGKVIHAGAQGGEVYVWVEFEAETHHQRELSYVVVPTGGAFNAQGMIHFKTIQMSNGLVWHLYLEE